MMVSIFVSLVRYLTCYDSVFFVLLVRLIWQSIFLSRWSGIFVVAAEPVETGGGVSRGTKWRGQQSRPDALSSLRQTAVAPRQSQWPISRFMMSHIYRQHYKWKNIRKQYKHHINFIIINKHNSIDELFDCLNVWAWHRFQYLGS